VAIGWLACTIPTPIPAHSLRNGLQFDPAIEDRTLDHGALACPRRWEEDECLPQISLQLRGLTRVSLLMDKKGSRLRSTPPPMFQEKPALKAGFLLPGIACPGGISHRQSGDPKEQSAAALA
jgi:hypothetical protein